MAANPLRRIRLDKPICVCLRESRHNNFQNALLRVMESNITHGLMYFDCYPNLELSCIDDLSIHKGLTSNIHTKGYDMNPRSKNTLIVYRVYYKAMTSLVNPRFYYHIQKVKRLFF